MRLSHNMFSLKIYNNYKSELAHHSKSLENISSGKKLNYAKDNPGKIGDSERLKMEITANEAAQSNTQDTNSMLQTFDGSLQEVNNNLSRLGQLAVEAANGTYNDDDKKLIQAEVDTIKKSINDLVNNTDFNGINLNAVPLSPTPAPNVVTTKHAQIGALPDEKIDLPFFNIDTKGLDIDDVDVTKPNGANKALDKITKATASISSIRSTYGAIQSRLENNVTSIDETNQNYSSSQSGLEDADIAEEMVEFCRSQIVIQSSLSLMVQSNKLPHDALNVLSSVK